MSSSLNIALIALLDLAVIAALAAVCVVPFRLGRQRRAGTVLEFRHDRLEPSRWAA
jgi:hypothetical protein